MTILHGDDRIYNSIFVQNEPVKEAKFLGRYGIYDGK